MPEPDIDGVLGDYSLQRQPVDETGFNDLVTMLRSAKQIMDAAMVAGFTESQAFQHCRDFTQKMWEAAAAAATGD